MLRCIFFGRGVEEDNKTGMKWLQKSVNQGWPDAQLLLGGLYEEGVGVKQDYAKAAFWYRKAAEKGVCKGPIRDRDAFASRKGNSTKLRRSFRVVP